MATPPTIASQIALAPTTPVENYMPTPSPVLRLASQFDKVSLSTPEQANDNNDSNVTPNLTVPDSFQETCPEQHLAHYIPPGTPAPSADASGLGTPMTIATQQAEEPAVPTPEPSASPQSEQPATAELQVQATPQQGPAANPEAALDNGQKTEKNEPGPALRSAVDEEPAMAKGPTEQGTPNLNSQTAPPTENSNQSLQEKGTPTAAKATSPQPNLPANKMTKYEDGTYWRQDFFIF